MSYLSARLRRLAAGRQDELRTLAQRSTQVLVVAAVVGVITGVGVAAFDRVVVDGMLERVERLPLWLVAVCPGVGLGIAALVLKYAGGGASPSTADEYLRSFHDPEYQPTGRALVARMVAAVATLGFGGAMGLEGPSLYLGSSLGDRIQRRLPAVFRNADRRVLMVAGAAAGVAAIFKAPATGAVFALEVPYQDDLARRMLLPALVSAACGYLAFVAINGTTPLFSVVGSPAFDLRDLAGAVALGAVAGIGARLFAGVLRAAKRLVGRVPTVIRVALAGAVLAALFVVARLTTGESLTIGPGYDTISWALDPHYSVWLVLLILVLRCTATSAVVAGGGVGGLFVPLVVGGALAGRALGGAFHALDTSLFAVVGVAAFLGAGYRVPLAAVTFVAETTGQPAFVVPGLLAAVAAELVMGRSSVTAYQRAADA